MNSGFRNLTLSLLLVVLAAPAFSQPTKGASELGLNGAVIIPDISPSDTTGLVDLSYGYYFRAHDLVGLNTITVLSKDVQDIYLLGRYRHLFSISTPRIFPFVGAGGGINVLASSGSPTSHWGLGSGEAGVKFFVSQRTAFEVAYDLLYVNVKDASFRQASFGAITFGFTYTFGGKKNTTERPVNGSPPSAAAVSTKSIQTEPPNAEPRPVAPSPPPSSQPSRYRGAAMQVAVLGLAVVSRGSEGAEVVEVVQGSVAGLAGLQPGDVINGIDGKTVRTPMELAAELSGRAAGEKVRLAFMARGLWQTERTVVLEAQK